MSQLHTWVSDLCSYTAACTLIKSLFGELIVACRMLFSCSCWSHLSESCSNWTSARSRGLIRTVTTCNWPTVRLEKAGAVGLFFCDGDVTRRAKNRWNRPELKTAWWRHGSTERVLFLAKCIRNVKYSDLLSASHVGLHVSIPQGGS